MQHDWVQWIPWSMIECSGFYAAWPKSSRLNAVDSMHCDWMRCNPCSVVKCILSECSGFHAAGRNGTLLNAVDFMQHDWMQWIPWSMIECNGFMQHGPKHPDWMQWIPCSVIDCSGLHAAWRNGTLLNAVDIMQPDWMQWIPCSVIEIGRASCRERV